MVKNEISTLHSCTMYGMYGTPRNWIDPPPLEVDPDSWRPIETLDTSRGRWRDSATGQYSSLDGKK